MFLTSDPNNVCLQARTLFLVMREKQQTSEQLNDIRTPTVKSLRGEKGLTEVGIATMTLTASTIA